MARTYRLGAARRAVNALTTALVRMGMAGRSTYLLTTVGRSSGLARTTPVVLVRAEDHLWLVSPYGQVGWVHNVRAHPEVVLQRGRTRVRMIADEVDGGAAGPILRRYLSQARVTAPYFDARASDPASAFTAEADRHPVFRLTGSP
jgi:deazaflavin-dependent oxidoreductase (nitroreductase family)